MYDVVNIISTKLIYLTILVYQRKVPKPLQGPAITDHVDPNTFRGGPVNRQECREILVEAGVAVPTRKPRKRKAIAMESGANVEKALLPKKKAVAPKKREFYA